MFNIITSFLLATCLIGGISAAPASLVEPATTPSYTDVELQATNFPALTNDNLLPPVEQLALGTLPNGPLPPPGGISADGITNLQLIELNEFFEASFFTSLLSNITKNVPGYEINDEKERNEIINALVAIIAAKELHGIFADKALLSQSQPTIRGCHFKFPTTTFDGAIALAATFTDVVLGTLQDVIEIFAINNDDSLTRGVASVVGQEGQQDGFFRLLEKKGKVPSELPFLTTSTRDFAFSFLEQSVVVSCPNNNDDVLKQKLKIFGVLNLLTTNIEPKDQTLQFSFDLKSLDATYGNSYRSAYDWSEVSLVYINQQNTPIVEKVQNVQVDGIQVTFEAFFPYTENLLNGLTIAAVTRCGGPFADASAVAEETLFAPAFIEIN
ncbi:hypothetical protein NA57DRAFT_49804 [Rhizodiscina lignyota]|uniref:Sexual development protein n=1 Tax=Rhizodiscina lignyota TaxID=1504668 RepID=A0A9P4M4B8_9PEZI|nr:hypothetical protein NA57DRAFT_49804 [Rhizodiscina lignyota]